MSLARAVAAGAVLLAGARALAAEPEGRVHLSLPSCELPALPLEQVKTAVSIELNTSGLSLVPESEPPSVGDIEASIQTPCADDSVLELRATWGSKSGGRALKLGELPVPARPRAVALALAELLAALRPDDEATPIPVELAEEPAPPSDATARGAEARATPPSTPAPKAPSPEPRHALAPGSMDGGRDVRPTQETSSSARYALTLKGEIRSFALEPVVAGFRLGYEFKRFTLGMAVLRGVANGSYGSVAATIAYGYFEWRIHEFGRPESPWFTFGPRFGLGAVALAPTPSVSSTGVSSTDFYLDIAQSCEFWATLPPFRFGTQLEVGYAKGAIAYETGHRLASYGGVFGSVLLEATLLL